MSLLWILSNKLYHKQYNFLVCYTFHLKSFILKFSFTFIRLIRIKCVQLAVYFMAYLSVSVTVSLSSHFPVTCSLRRWLTQTRTALGRPSSWALTSCSVCTLHSSRCGAFFSSFFCEAFSHKFCFVLHFLSHLP